MVVAHAALAVLTAVLAAFSAVMKLRRNPQVVATIHDLVGVPMKWLNALAACELAGAAALLAGLKWPSLGIVAAGALTIYFVVAVAAHIRVGDAKGIGPAVLMLLLSAGSLVTRVLTA